MARVPQGGRVGGRCRRVESSAWGSFGWIGLLYTRHYTRKGAEHQALPPPMFLPTNQSGGKLFEVWHLYQFTESRNVLDEASCLVAITHIQRELANGLILIELQAAT